MPIVALYERLRAVTVDTTAGDDALSGPKPDTSPLSASPNSPPDARSNGVTARTCIYTRQTARQ